MFKLVISAVLICCVASQLVIPNLEGKSPSNALFLYSKLMQTFLDDIENQIIESFEQKSEYGLKESIVDLRSVMSLSAVIDDVLTRVSAEEENDIRNVRQAIESLQKSSITARQISQILSNEDQQKYSSDVDQTLRFAQHIDDTIQTLETKL